MMFLQTALSMNIIKSQQVNRYSMSKAISDQQLRKWASGPENPENEFVLSGATFGDVYDLAYSLKKTFAENNMHNRAVCCA